MAPFSFLSAFFSPTVRREVREMMKKWKRVRGWIKRENEEGTQARQRGRFRSASILNKYNVHCWWRCCLLMGIQSPLLFLSPSKSAYFFLSCLILSVRILSRRGRGGEINSFSLSITYVLIIFLLIFWILPPSSIIFPPLLRHHFLSPFSQSFQSLYIWFTWLVTWITLTYLSFLLSSHLGVSLTFSSRWESSISWTIQIVKRRIFILSLKLKDVLLGGKRFPISF